MMENQNKKTEILNNIEKLKEESYTICQRWQIPQNHE